MKCVIIKYNAGNIQSVLFALQRLQIDAIVTDDAEEILSADKIIFPGVGEADTAMRYLREKKMDILIQSLTQPFLGICLGMQLLCNYSEENNTPCLNIFDDLIVTKFQAKDNKIKIPQMGWNVAYDLQTPIFKNLKEEIFTYFVHSFYVPLSENTIAKTNYIQPYSSAIRKNNFYGVQFHPEKSAEAGAIILKNFLDL